MRTSHRRRNNALLCCAFFASGASALIFEALWFHQAGLAFGNSVWASSLVLAAFMAGLALGNGLCAWHGDRFRSALGTYARAELVVATSGVALVLLLPGLGKLLAPLASSLGAHPLALSFLRFGVAWVLLLVPSTAMGMSLPLVLRALGASEERFGSALGLMYGLNTLGAVLGVVATEVLLLGMFGVRGTSFVAAAFSVVAAMLAVRVLPLDEAPIRHERSGSLLPRRGRLWLFAAFVSGFALLGLEVVWLRFLMLFLNDTPLAFALVLAVVLAGIALGGLLASAWLAKIADAHRFASFVAQLAGLSGVGGLLLYRSFLQRYLNFNDTSLSILAVATPLVLPTALASGALFTLLGASLRRVTASDATASALLVLCNTVGAACGSLVAGFVLLPRLGMEYALVGLFSLYAALGLLLSMQRGVASALRVSSLVTMVATMACFPFGDVRSVYVAGSAGRWMRQGDRLLEVRETLGATIVHIRHAYAGVATFDQLATDAYSMSVNDFAARRYMELFVFLPAAIHPQLKHALLIGYGIGNTAQALVRTQEIERIEVAEVSRDMLDLARKIEPRRGPQPLDDPRVHVNIEDGRYFLQTTTQHFDLITGEPPPPMMAGVSNLYSREYFELVHQRLAEGGVATYWLPMMNLSARTASSIIAAYCAAFEDCSLWHGSASNFMLMGTRHARGPVAVQEFGRQFADPVLRDELQAVGFEDPAQLGALFIGDAAYLKELTHDALPITDDRPKRMHQAGTREERDAMVWQWRDTQAARERFAHSELIARLWPEALRGPTLRQFENQRLINDLLFPDQTPVRQMEVLHQVLSGTRLRMPVLLLLGSNSDVQRASLRLSPTEREAPEWLLQRAAGQLADRDYAAALAVLQRVPARLLPFAELPEYVQYVVQRESGLRGAQDTEAP